MKMCHCKWRNRKESLNTASEGKTHSVDMFSPYVFLTLFVWGPGNEHGKVSCSSVFSKPRVTAWAGQGECAVPEVLGCDGGASGEGLCLAGCRAGP